MVNKLDCRATHMTQNAFHIQPAARSSQQRWMNIALVFGLWTLFGFIYGNQEYFSLRGAGRIFPWRQILAWQMLAWYPWALFTFLILWLGRRFPIERPSRGRSLAVHLPGSILLGLVAAGHYYVISHWISPFSGGSSLTWTMYLSYVAGYLHTYFFTYWAILGVGYAFAYYQKFREREVRAAQLESQLAQAQLHALKMQLHPHFLFNTLHAIAGLVRQHREEAAVDMIAGLSELLRYTLENAGRQEVPLRHELDFLDRYLAIQQMRFSDRLKVRMKIAPDALDAYVPNLILQPLVENSIRHGIARHADAGLIEISAWREHGDLQINVLDDGPGLPEDWQMDQNDGIGLANTQARLQQLYGPAHRFALGNAKSGGVVATLIIPWRLGRQELEGEQPKG
jgi:two-component system LytT family sensor kinase